ncbi:unnamed protein product [Paramecium sonneborni]|uniref:Uncharacterized protein n=1 Tax=Paramecium sonneborni TaxID=65129 RepID=A0A8S1RQF9_9CILI|nr:unnamed protein product [Paramecium sonneborni]
MEIVQLKIKINFMTAIFTQQRNEEQDYSQRIRKIQIRYRLRFQKFKFEKEHILD